MVKSTSILYALMVCLLITSCKDETKKQDPVVDKEVPTEAPVMDATPRAEKRVLTEEDRSLLQSVMARIINNSGLKKFASYTVTAQLPDTLSAKGNYIVFAPNNAAFNALSESKVAFYSNVENLGELSNLLKSHIIVGETNGIDFKNNWPKEGKTTVKTMSGKTLTVKKTADKIEVSDSKSKKAVVVNNEVNASNGMVYVIDKVLFTN